MLDEVQEAKNLPRLVGNPMASDGERQRKGLG